MRSWLLKAVALWRAQASLVWASKLVLTAAGLAALILAVAWWMRPDMVREPPRPSPEDVAHVTESRRPKLDPANPPRVQLDVNYERAPGTPEPAWYPKGEPEILKPLVASGKLPPIVERVGPEPLVLRSQEIGVYGGIWRQATFSDSAAFQYMQRRLGQNKLVNWSPQGYPVVPHLARSVRQNADATEFVFELRRGVRWSDGHPFTADDILYWWEHEAQHPAFSSTALPPFMRVRGKLGRVERLGDYSVKFSFPHPNGLFLPKLATFFGLLLTESPAHYLRQFHPDLGDKALIDRVMRQRGLPSHNAVYMDVKRLENPEHPRLWPWIYRTHTATAPFNFERNPYYFAVDSEGNQLPYIDRVQMQRKIGEALKASTLSGEYPFAPISGDVYTLMMTEAPRRGMRVTHWYRGDRSPFIIHPNLNRYVEPLVPGREAAHRDTKNKHELLNDKRFRQALSLAIKRQDIIDSEYAGLGVSAAQAAPDEHSIFYEPSALSAFTEHDPERANALLDAIGLTARDIEGMRLFKDGSQMTFFVHFAHPHFATMAQFIVEDWRKVGIRALPLQQGDRLYYSEKSLLKHDFDLWTSNNEFLPTLEARCFVPLREESNFGIGFSRWYQRGGLYGDPRANAPDAVAPPQGHPIRRAYELYEAMSELATPEEQAVKFREILKIAADNVWTIGVNTMPPYAVLVHESFRNVPDDVVFTWDFLSPGNAYPERFFFSSPVSSEESEASITQAILSVTPPADSPRTTAASVAEEPGVLSRVLKFLFWGVGLLLLVLLVARHPYVGRRIAVMVPTLFAISVVIFTIIQLPPEDFLTAKAMELERTGEQANLEAVAQLREMFYLNDPQLVRYARWLGLRWFLTFDEADQGLLQGNLGRSMDSLQRVETILGDRILLTVLVSLGSILFTWALSIPIGIYSAVRQYSITDMVVTFLGFLGMCIPPFLLALLLMHAGHKYFDLNVSGLFSAEFADQPWSLAKVWDFIKHAWLPVIVLAVGGTAGLIRVLRGNLLDELNKPYVVAARARGVRPVKLLLKYPVRLALNPFISGIGALFPALVSGGAIVGIVMSLPIIGPLLLEALMMEDMYLAGSMLMVLSLLSVFGTLVSDLLLLWLDPRIRFQERSQ